jgi:hypothetical protein
MKPTELLTLLTEAGTTPESVRELLKPLAARGGLLPPTHAGVVLEALHVHRESGIELRLALLEHLDGESATKFFYSPCGVRPGEAVEILEVMQDPSWEGVQPRFVVGALYRYTESFAGRWWVERQVGKVWEQGWSVPLCELAEYVVEHCPTSWWAGGGTDSVFSPAQVEPGPFRAALSAVLAPLEPEAVELLTVLASESDDRLSRLVAAVAELNRPPVRH